MWLTLILFIFVVQIGAIILLEFKKPDKTISWIFILYLFPLIGFIIYFFIAEEYQDTRLHRRKLWRASLTATARIAGWKKEDAGSEKVRHYERLFRLLEHPVFSPLTANNRAKVLANGEETYRAILEAMERAERYIHVEYYIIRDDRIGTRFRDVWARKAQQGVRVKILYDGIGSWKLRKRYIRHLRDHGVEIHCFLPPLLAFLNRRINYRNHRKIIVVDGKVGFLGGINIGDEYLGADPRLGFWRDTHLQLEGDSVRELQRIFQKDWFFVTKRQSADDYAEDPVDFAENPDPDISPRPRLLAAVKSLESAAPAEKPGDSAGAGRAPEPVLIVSSGPDRSLQPILEVFFTAINAARRRVWIETPYFIPDPAIMMALKTAAMSGLDVRIIIPCVSDTKVVYWATLSYVEELIHVGVKFFQYKRGFMHAKVMIVDDLLASVGTANFDMRSFYSNFELSALLFGADSIRRLERDFLADLRGSEHIDPAKFAARPNSQKAKEVLARLLSPML